MNEFTVLCKLGMGRLFGRNVNDTSFVHAQ